jgi:hypothetical protein
MGGQIVLICTADCSPTGLRASARAQMCARTQSGDTASAGDGAKNGGKHTHTCSYPLVVV